MLVVVVVVVLKIMSKWINVNDRLPGNTVGTVLVIWEREYIGQGMPKPPNQIIQIGMIDDAGDWVDAWTEHHFDVVESGGVMGGSVSYWRPMDDLYEDIPGYSDEI